MGVCQKLIFSFFSVDGASRSLGRQVSGRPQGRVDPLVCTGPAGLPLSKKKATPKTNPPPQRGRGMVPTTPSLAPRSTSLTHGAWRWAPCEVSTGGRRGLSGWHTQTTPMSTRLPATSSSPPPRPPKKTSSVFASPRPRPTPPPPPSLRASLIRRLTPCQTPRLTPRLIRRLTPRMTPNRKTAPTLAQPLTQISKCGTPKMGPKKAEKSSHSNR